MRQPPQEGQSTPLARERDEAIEVTRVAMEPQEAVGENPAAQVRAKLLLDEAGRRMIAFAGAREEALELLANHRVQIRLFRAASFVAPSGGCRRSTGKGGVRGDLGGHSSRALREAYRD